MAAAFVAYQLFEVIFVQVRLEHRSLHLGPFLTIAGGLVGLELYGLGGALLAVTLLAAAVAVADELAPR